MRRIIFRELIPPGRLAIVLGATIAATAVGMPVSAHAQSSRIDAPFDTMQFAAALEVDLPASKRVAKGLYARDVAVGEGRVAGRGDELTVRYAGWLIDGSPFTTPSEPPASFKLGAGIVIAGWERGLSGMRVGGRRQLVIGPELGYGRKQSGPIPPNSVLVFDIELISVR
jgi:FKBP-type peptidyl-prolyl cis-trans isomerase FkpA